MDRGEHLFLCVRSFLKTQANTSCFLWKSLASIAGGNKSSIVSTLILSRKYSSANLDQYGVIPDVSPDILLDCYIWIWLQVAARKSRERDNWQLPLQCFRNPSWKKHRDYENPKRYIRKLPPHKQIISVFCLRDLFFNTVTTVDALTLTCAESSCHATILVESFSDLCIVYSVMDLYWVYMAYYKS